MTQYGARVIVVDDEEASRYALVRPLRSAGYEVLEAVSGADALKLAEAAEPELIVLDVRLPDMLGFDVAEQLRARPTTQSVAILQISASYTAADAQALGLQRGADAYLVQPVEAQVIVAAVGALLRMRRAEQVAQRERDAAERALVLAEQQRERAEASENRQRELVGERDRLVQQLREESQRKNEFISMMSHELRNPLAPIRNCSFILSMNSTLDTQARRATEVIERQAKHLTRLVDDLLDITRISSGKFRLDFVTSDVVEIVRRTVEDLRSTLEEHEVTLVLPDVPVLVDADATRLSQVIGNLLHNAAKFTPVPGQIRVSVERLAEGVSIDVFDTGVGIDRETLPLIFEPFVQAESSLGRSVGGLGLGLALVKGIVELHHGTVRVRSSGRGTGSQFTVTFPVSQSSSIGQVIDQHSCDALSGHQRVLVIDDNADAADCMVEAIGLLGEYEVSVAYSGTEGLALARVVHPDIVFCDIGLPDIDGYEVARLMREEPSLSGAYIIALTGYAQAEHKRNALSVGFDLHLAKPADITMVKQAFREAATRVE